LAKPGEVTEERNARLRHALCSLHLAHGTEQGPQVIRAVCQFPTEPHLLGRFGDRSVPEEFGLGEGGFRFLQFAD
jgi:hypothetical protein